MESNVTPIQALFESAEEYGKTTIELFGMNAIDKSAEVISSLFSRVVVLMVVTLLIFILSIGIALWVGEMLGKPYYGFFVISGFYCIVVLLIYSFRNQWLKKPVSNSIISQMLKKREA